LQSDVFPWLGKRSITEIDALEILAVLKRIDSRGARFTAHRVRSEKEKREIAGNVAHAQEV